MCSRFWSKMIGKAAMIPHNPLLAQAICSLKLIAREILLQSFGSPLGGLLTAFVVVNVYLIPVFLGFQSSAGNDVLANA
ncbi:MAG: hypothetical protein RMJ84_05335 [Sandaracinaceae bacterium]|nr:hypothetical protein [Sandaracinaceae bacterium]